MNTLYWAFARKIRHTISTHTSTVSNYSIVDYIYICRVFFFNNIVFQLFGSFADNLTGFFLGEFFSGGISLIPEEIGIAKILNFVTHATYLLKLLSSQRQLVDMDDLPVPREIELLAIKHQHHMIVTSWLFLLTHTRAFFTLAANNLETMIFFSLHSGLVWISKFIARRYPTQQIIFRTGQRWNWARIVWGGKILIFLFFCELPIWVPAFIAIEFFCLFAVFPRKKLIFPFLLHKTFLDVVIFHRMTNKHAQLQPHIFLYTFLCFFFFACFVLRFKKNCQPFFWNS